MVKSVNQKTNYFFEAAMKKSLRAFLFRVTKDMGAGGVHLSSAVPLD